MNRSRCIGGFLWLAAFLRAAEPAAPPCGGPDYRMGLAHSSGQISLPGEPVRRTYFIDLNRVYREPQTFGGPRGERFKAWLFEKKFAPNPRTGLEQDVSTLVCVEIATNRSVTVVMGQEVNLAKGK